MPRITTALNSALMALLLVVSTAIFADETRPSTVSPFDQIERVTVNLLKVISDHSEGFPENEQAYFAALDNLLEEHIDFQYIAKKVMGPYVKAADIDQRKAFESKFKEGLIETYGRGLVSYGDEQIVLVNKQELEPGKRMVSVKQEIRSDGSIFPIEYSMARSKKTGKWKAINVVINGINMRNIFQSQFVNAAQKAGGNIDTVIADWSAE
jgi:phospholipid transport system substrate-binding protein